MTHPITALQSLLVPALRAAGLVVHDGPANLREPVAIVIGRHGTTLRDADTAPVTEHRIDLVIWAPHASRRIALRTAEQALEVLMTTPLAGSGVRVTHRQLLSTETVIDASTHRARATLALRFFTEPS